MSYGEIESVPLAIPDWIRGDGRLIVEVGSGKGLFLCNAATAMPSDYFVGVEIAGKFARLANDRLQKKGLANAAVVAGDALPFIESYLPDARVDEVHVYFPDPWWKKRHKSRRVLSDEMLVQIERVLVPTGILHFWTDVLDYFELASEAILQVTSLFGPEYVPESPAHHDLDYRTHFERRTRRNGLPVYRGQFRKSAQATRA